MLKIYTEEEIEILATSVNTTDSKKLKLIKEASHYSTGMYNKTGISSNKDSKCYKIIGIISSTTPKQDIHYNYLLANGTLPTCCSEENTNSKPTIMTGRRKEKKRGNGLKICVDGRSEGKSEIATSGIEKDSEDKIQEYEKENPDWIARVYGTERSVENQCGDGVRLIVSLVVVLLIVVIVFMFVTDWKWNLGENIFSVSSLRRRVLH
eukprot:TRINITY_DN10735_c0_g1_i19.p1 TRINITY_DN10735_c0_g1~~TRINITY_DN10735_c0_g1_i19.p1  ORF type:complete len:208 (-),score=39.10 TRINITY_DN10735_c0_g1_i19:68-691(-)